MTNSDGALKGGLFVGMQSLPIPGLVSTLRNRHFFILDVLILLITPTLALAFR